VEEPGLTIMRVGTGSRKGHLSHIKLRHCVVRDGQAEYFVEEHTLGLYSPGEYLGALKSVGLTAWHEPEGLMGRGLFIGRLD
jgi:hypothetical protein